MSYIGNRKDSRVSPTGFDKSQVGQSPRILNIVSQDEVQTPVELKVS